jgi:hypothetical protein
MLDAELRSESATSIRDPGFAFGIQHSPFVIDRAHKKARTAEAARAFE